jgi:hypothetical protein
MKVNSVKERITLPTFTSILLYGQLGMCEIAHVPHCEITNIYS